VVSFGLTPDDAWRLTIPEYSVLIGQLNDNEHRMNYRAAMIVAAIYNVNRGKSRKNKPFTPEEILGIKREQKPDEMLDMARKITQRFGGEVV